MSNLEKNIAIIYGAIDEFNKSQDIDGQLEKNGDTTLFSRPGFTDKSILDSLSLVYFLVTVEEFLQKEYGDSFNLKTQELIESKEQNLKNISSLVLYIENLLNKK